MTATMQMKAMKNAITDAPSSTIAAMAVAWYMFRLISNKLHSPLFSKDFSHLGRKLTLSPDA